MHAHYLMAQPSASVCILRLSAIGDTCHVVPIIRTLQHVWPTTQLTWIIGKTEARLMKLVDGVELITVDKRSGLSGLRNLREQLRGRQYDVLLHMQLAIRASAMAHAVNAPIKLGFDRARARELQWLFTNQRIAARTREHVLDSFFGFLAALGIEERVLQWNVPLPADAVGYAEWLIPDSQPTLVISPCSSHSLRNWAADRYAAVADYAVERHGMRVILAGGPTALEKETGAAIERLVKDPGRESDRQGHPAPAPGIAEPGAGPDRARFRARPHGHHGGHARDWLICGYEPRTQRSLPFAPMVRGCLRRGCGARSAARLRTSCRGRARSRFPGVMDLITVPSVTAKLDELLR